MNLLQQHIQRGLRVEPRHSGFIAHYTLADDFPILPDHFPTQPIFPGICLLQAVLLAAASAAHVPKLHLRTLKNAKLLQPLRPGDTMQISADVSPAPNSDWIIKARITVDGQKRADLSMTATQAIAETGAA